MTPTAKKLRVSTAINTREQPDVPSRLPMVSSATSGRLYRHELSNVRRNIATTAANALIVTNRAFQPFSHSCPDCAAGLYRIGHRLPEGEHRDLRLKTGILDCAADFLFVAHDVGKVFVV
jgi:hypothetical protein